MLIAGLTPRLPRAVVFDMDGLMLDTERLDRWAWQTVASRHGFDFTDALHATLIGRRLAETEAELRAHLGPRIDFPSVRGEVSALWQEQVAARGAPLKPGLLELLDRLDTLRIPKAVATSTVRESALRSLGALRARLDAAVYGDEVERGKPAPDIYLRAAEALRVAPGECIALEDSLAGVASARAAGMTVVMVPDLVAPSAWVPHVCDSLGTVARWLDAGQALGDQAGRL